MANTNYNAKDLVILEGLDAVRMRPGMYIGTTGNRGLHHILWEIVDNAIDEAANGFATSIDVRLYADGSVSVRDNGRGIPVDIHPKLKISGVEVVFTQLHAGGKFDNNNYAYSGGLHGVGASVTNALSRWLEVEVYKDGSVYHQRFESVEDEKGKIHSGVPVTTLTKLDKKTKLKGSFIHFLPDDRVFGKEKFSWDVISTKLKELAFLNRGLEINLTKEGTADIEEKAITFKYDGGIVDYVVYINEAKTAMYPTPMYIEDKSKDFEVTVAIQHTDSFSESVFSYVNNIPTPEGGTHETGFKSAYTKVMNEFARTRGLLKEKDANLLGEDFREGMTAVLCIKMKNVQFEGQTKTKLGNPEARTAVESAVIAKLGELVAEKANIPDCEKIVLKAIAAAKAREAAKKAKDLSRQKNSLSSLALVGKLANCSGRHYERNELFIVEGDSAGGTAKQGRNREFQAILPLRGKPLNAEKKRIDQILQNEEIRTIITALGAGFDDDFDLNALKFDKVIILADADQDGAHIRAILLTFFYRYMKELITEGHVYMGMPPLYRIEHKGKVIYAYDDKDLETQLADISGNNYTLQRYKGLGEMDASQLWETTMDPNRRQIIRVTIDDAARAEHLVSTWMGDNVDARKSIINEYADFNKKDEFVKYMD